MSSNKTGGPAFPANHFDMADNEHGMTLRDYFAAKAMAAQISGPMSSDVNGLIRAIRQAGLQSADEIYARNAYRIADAMLKEREK